MAASTYVQVPGYYWDRDLNNGMWVAPEPGNWCEEGHEYVHKKKANVPKIRNTTQQNQESQEAAEETTESLTKIIEKLDGSRKPEVQRGENGTIFIWHTRQLLTPMLRIGTKECNLKP